MDKPSIRPARPFFSSGPTAKRPGWKPENLSFSSLGRSHRSDIAKQSLIRLIEKSKQILGIPQDYLLGIVPASDTGAMEMALWNLLGSAPVNVLAWDAFGKDWAHDITQELKITARILSAPYGELPDLSTIDPIADIVFTWNGTTSGTRVPNGNWIADPRKGLTICDATSAVFAMDIPWRKLDVVTWSWQKALGGEGGHGMLALSPRAVQRLEAYPPQRALPKIFRLTKDGILQKGIFKGDTINTPSLLAVEDQIDALDWAQSIGGLPALIARSQRNLSCLEEWSAKRNWISFLAKDPAHRSSSSICFQLEAEAAKAISSLLAQEEVAFDIAAYRDAPPGLRIWGGPTVDLEDIQKLLPWLDWAYHTVTRKI